MKMCLDKWSLHIEHLEHLSSDKSIPSKDRQKLIGYLKKWKHERILLMIAMFIDLLEIPLFLSHALQKEKVNLVSAMRAITKTNKHLALFKKKPFTKIPHVKHLPSKCNQIDGENYYQNVELSNFEAFFDSLSPKKSKFLDAVESSIKDGLSEEIKSNKIFESIVQILNIEAWERKNRPQW